jgi:hypothetical protein
MGRGVCGRWPKVESSCGAPRATIHHVGPRHVWIVRGAQFDACPAGVPIVDVATMSVAVVPVFEALVWRGGVTRTFARCSWLCIRRLLVATADTTTTAIYVASSQSMPIVGCVMLLLSRVVGWGYLLMQRHAVL